MTAECIARHHHTRRTPVQARTACRRCRAGVPAIERQFELPLVGNEPRPQPLAVDRHVVGHALRDRHPHRIRRQHQRPMLAEGGIYRRQQRLVVDLGHNGGVVVVAALNVASEHFPDRLIRPALLQRPTRRLHLVNGKRDGRAIGDGLCHGIPGKKSGRTKALSPVVRADSSAAGDHTWSTSKLDMFLLYSPCPPCLRGES